MQQGALCAGDALESKLRAELKRFDCFDISDVEGPSLRIAVYDEQSKSTQRMATGDLARTVRQSAATPWIYAACDGKRDGGIGDPHGLLSLQPGARTLIHAIRSSLLPERWGNQPQPAIERPDGPLHRILTMQMDHRITALSCLMDLDFNKPKLLAIVEEARAKTLHYLHQPM